jgi:DNA-binding XRE family transcriptional regulator
MAKRADASPPQPARRAGRPKNSKSRIPLVPVVKPKPPANGSKAELSPPPAPGEMMPDDLLAIFGANLKSARLKSGLKQSDVAERTGLTQQRLSLIEAGHQNLTLKTMMRLAQVVDHNVSAMLVKVQARRKKSDTPP